MNYSNIRDLPQEGPKQNKDSWHQLFETLKNNDNLWISAVAQDTNVQAVQDKFFDDVLFNKYPKYLTIKRNLNSATVLDSISSIPNHEAIELYDLCKTYAKNVLLAIRSIGALPEKGPGTNNFDGWKALFYELCINDHCFVATNDSNDVQNKFFDGELNKKYSKYLKIDTTSNTAEVLDNIKNITDAEADALYNLCVEYAKNVLSAIRTARLKTITPFDSKNAWMYGKGRRERYQNERFKEILNFGYSWINTAIQMNIDGCLHCASKNDTAGQGARELNIKLLAQYAVFLKHGTYWPNTGDFYTPLDLEHDGKKGCYPDNIESHWKAMTQNAEYLSYDPITKRNTYTGYFLIRL